MNKFYDKNGIELVPGMVVLYRGYNKLPKLNIVTKIGYSDREETIVCFFLHNNIIIGNNIIYNYLVSNICKNDLEVVCQ